MVTKFDIFIEQGLFNHTGVDFVTYYDKRHKMFTARAANARIGKHLIIAPYAEQINRPAMKRFWHSLDDESRAIAESFEGGPGFFQFMRDNGLIDFYDQAYAEAAEVFLSNWEAHNNLNIAWDCVKADWTIN
ncbi:MAG: hypothetical protein E7454_01620 [Ruminococcaceae bacterium]|nr:hypothetical protein [Oscillospiraceae bacterium]